MAEVTILDGGMGRELKRMGAPFRQPEWSALALLEGPDYVARAHAAFVAAGAEVVTTNAYAIVPFHLGEARFAERGRDLAALAGRLARQAADADEGVRVAGSLPPLFGSYRPDLFDPARAPALLEVLVGEQAPWVDLWLGETLSAIAEAAAVRAALGDDARPLWLSFTLRDDGAATAPQLRSGETVADAARAAGDLGATALLFNCSQPEVMGPAVSDAVDALARLGADLPVGVYANAFGPRAADYRANAGLSVLREDLPPPAYLAWAEDWVGRGARLVGGCCGIGPEHIAALASAFRKS
jgi:S-methylmethionine-dependent homocysteine/selenocysteine methylase